MIDDHVLEFVAQSLPAAPARVLEVGAGAGELAEELRERGYEVVAIDPAGAGSGRVEQVHLHELDQPDGSFDAAVAVVSLHHVEPLAQSMARLGALLRAGAPVVVDEFDVACFDERAAAWWIDQREIVSGHAHDSPEALVRTLRDHLHPVALIRNHLQRAGFALGSLTRGPYLYRWEVPAGLRGAEEQLIAAEQIPATGARFIAVRS